MKKYKFLLKQHIGSAGIPVVDLLQIVSRGELIAKKEGLGANIHSSVNGKVVEINDKEIIIEETEVNSDYIKLKDSDNMLEIIEEAGIVGMGGAGFPTSVKLNINLNKGMIIANAVECEPLLKHNIKQIIENPEVVYKGMKYAMQITNASEAVLAIKEKNVEAIKSFEKIINPNDGIRIAQLDDMYPMGEERAIIREVKNILLGVDQLPKEADCVILNSETLSRITEAIELKRPVISKNMTLVGKFSDGQTYKVFTDVPIGTSVREILDQTDINLENYGEIVMGGPFTGLSTDLDAPITKTTGGIIVTMEFLREHREMGLLVCACGGDEKRLREIAEKMEATVVGVEKCKQAVDVRGNLKCENPGHCPGQAEKILSLRKQGAKVLLISNCSDCSNTVMCVAPNLKMPVYHSTDHILRTVGHPIIRKLKK